jgi:hypothetical protein
MFEDIIICIHLVDNKSIIIAEDDLTYDKIVKTGWLVETCNKLCVGNFGM